MRNTPPPIFPADKLTITRSVGRSDITINVAGVLNVPSDGPAARAELQLWVLDANKRVLLADDGTITRDQTDEKPVIFSRRFRLHPQLVRDAHRLSLVATLRSKQVVESWHLDLAELVQANPPLPGVAHAGSLTVTRGQLDSYGDVRLSMFAQHKLADGRTNNGDHRLAFTVFDEHQRLIYTDDTSLRNYPTNTAEIRFGERFSVQSWVLERGLSAHIELINEEVRATPPIDIAWVEVTELAEEN